MLSPEDCVRFYKETSRKGERAADWSQATSSVSYDLRDRVSRLEKGALVGVNFKGLPEPELYVLLFASAWESGSYQLSWWFLPTYERLRRLYGDKMETLFFGVRHDAAGNLGLAKAAPMPWLVADYNSQSSIEVFQNFAPEHGFCMMLVSREGVPLVAAEVDTVQGMKKFIDELCATMGAADEANPFFWKDRAYYLANVRPVQFADKSAPPLMLGNPMRPSLLRQKKIDRIDAKLEIAADGKVTAAVISNKEAMSPALAAALEKALKSSCVFVPAIERGKAVAAPYDFEYVVPDEKTAMEADRDWVFLSARKEISIPSWLLLRPIPVPPIVFSKVDHEDAEGRLVMTPVLIGKEAVSNQAQMSAFNSDFFEKEGAAGVHPFIGKTEQIEEKDYTWEKCDSQDGFVDLRNKSNCDHSVGYAWAEFEVAEGGPAYFGIGSDDGVKIWLNGKLVHDRWVQREAEIDQDIVPLQLTTGKNAILIKIQNAKGNWSFFSRLRR